MAKRVTIKQSFISFVLFNICILVQGFVLSVLWHMFMVPVFELPEISTATGMGIAYITRLLVGNKIVSDHGEISNEENENYIRDKIEDASFDLLNSFLIFIFGLMVFFLSLD